MLSTPLASGPASGPVPGPVPGPVAGQARGRRVAWLAVTAAAAAGLLAGCASSGSPQGGSTPAAGKTTSKAQGAGGTATPAGTGATGATAPGLGGLALCQPASLHVAVNASQAGATVGSTYYPVDFTNTASSACGLAGYPGMSFVTSGDGAGRQIGAAAQQNPGFGKVPVRLAAGGVAHAWLQVTQTANYPSATCQPVTAHWLRVYAPGETEALYLNHSFGTCSSASVQLLTVMPLRGGLGVQGSTP
jgi:Protein of unknown function (DUF4232)